MSRTRKTRSPKIRAVVEEVTLPKIVYRRPKRGDTHPASTQVLRGALRTMPSAYLVGLERIELCPRGGSIGQPFAKYRSKERAAFLYSLPMEWRWPSDDSGFLAELRRFGARVQSDEAVATVTWPNVAVRCVWFVLSVLAHELGHHYRDQDRFRKPSTTRRNEEIGAHLHAWRIEALQRARQRARRASGPNRPLQPTSSA